MNTFFWIVTIVSGLSTIILFICTAIMGRKIGEKSELPSWDVSEGFLEVLLSLFINCGRSIMNGLLRGEFKNPEEFSVIVAFLISLLVFLVSGVCCFVSA